MTPGLTTTAAEIAIAADRQSIFTAIGGLVERLLPGMTEVVLSEPPAFLIHTVSADGDGIDAWLTWELTSAPSPRWTQVRLVHDEADTAPAPAPDLDTVLRLLVEMAVTTTSHA